MRIGGDMIKPDPRRGLEYTPRSTYGLKDYVCTLPILHAGGCFISQASGRVGTVASCAQEAGYGSRW